MDAVTTDNYQCFILAGGLLECVMIPNPKIR